LQPIADFRPPMNGSLTAKPVSIESRGELPNPFQSIT